MQQKMNGKISRPATIISFRVQSRLYENESNAKWAYYGGCCSDDELTSDIRYSQSNFHCSAFRPPAHLNDINAERNEFGFFRETTLYTSSEGTMPNLELQAKINQMRKKQRWSKSGLNQLSSSGVLIGGLILLTSLMTMTLGVMASLQEPTLVGIGQCEPLPQIKLPLYWSSKYSLDGQDHHGPADLETIIGTPPYDDQDETTEEEKVNKEEEKKESPPPKEQEAKQQPTKGTKGNNNSGNNNNNAQVSPPAKNKNNNNNKNQQSNAAPKNNNQNGGQKQNNNKNNGKGKGKGRLLRQSSSTFVGDSNTASNGEMKNFVSDTKRSYGGEMFTRRSLEEANTSIGMIAGDGTTRASFEDVANGARVVVVVFYYADLRQCSLLGTDLSALIDEVNAELIASMMEMVDGVKDGEYYNNDAIDFIEGGNEGGNEGPMDEAGRRQRRKAAEQEGESDGQSNEVMETGESESTIPPELLPPVAAVILNNKWPITCDQYDTKCEPDNEELQSHQWQDKIMTAAPKLPMLQDTYKVNAWDTIFGTYYTDVLVYVDGHLYQYYPSALALSHSDILKENVDHSEGFILNNWPKFKQDLINAARVPFQWCKDGQVAYPEQEDTSMLQMQQQYVGNGGVPFYDEMPMGGSNRSETTSEDYFDFVLGFMFAGFAVGATLLLCVIWKCCIKCMEYWCIDVPIHRVRRMKIEHDGLGEFRPLTASTEDDDDDYFDDDLSEFYRHQNDMYDNEDDDDDESWSDEEDEYSHYHRILRDEQREKEQQQQQESNGSDQKKNNPKDFLFKLPKMMMKKKNSNVSSKKLSQKKKKRRPRHNRHYQDDADVDSEYGMATGADGGHGMGMDSDMGDSPNQDLYLAAADEETAALERLRNPQKVAEDFFRRQEEVELEMRVFREEAQREQEELKKRKAEEEEKERLRNEEMKKKTQSSSAGGSTEDDTISVRSTASSVKEHVASLMADDDEEEEQLGTADADLLGTTQGGEEDYNDDDDFDGVEFKQASTSIALRNATKRGDNPIVDLEENNFSGRYGGVKKSAADVDEEDEGGDHEGKTVPSLSAEMQQEGDLLGINDDVENTQTPSATTAVATIQAPSTEKKSETLIDPLDEEVDDNIDDIEGDEDEEGEDDEEEEDSDDDDESQDSALDLELLQQTVAKSIESEKKTKAS